MIKETLKKIFKILDVIDSVRAYSDDIVSMMALPSESLTANDTISYARLKEALKPLVSDNTITQQQYDLLFSDEMIITLQPHRNDFMTKENIDLLLVTRDYCLSLMSYVIGIYIPHFAIYCEAGKRLAMNTLGVTGKIIHLNYMVPADVFISNNLDKLLKAYRNEEYKCYGIITGEKDYIITNGEFDFSTQQPRKYYIKGLYVEGNIPDEKKIKKEIGKWHEKGVSLFEEPDCETTEKQFIELIRDYMYLTKQTLDNIDLDFSLELTEEGKANYEKYYIEYPGDGYWYDPEDDPYYVYMNEWE